MHTSIREHWENVYRSRQVNEFSWYQDYPATSLELVKRLNVPLAANIIDVGGGDSNFAKSLIELGYRNIWVLDISAFAITRAKKRLGKDAEFVNWVVSDVADFIPPVQFHLWHDRAVFHFLTSKKKITEYISVAENALHEDGHLIVGTFLEGGPLKCSGLEVKQYSESSLSATFGSHFQKRGCVTELHTTPSNMSQPFLFCYFEKQQLSPVRTSLTSNS